ncbi:hypothetical protein DF107_05790 [Burkholderia stagnalis]|uniref:hypothetical protein n=1 Tax=Burkholderia stagnalis TaxID=1503054 RepID=UPI000F595B55|nr:hypothetical protein [Burkholderia stagnalis]RQQ20796.1 hypothetical protein DF161_03755 [Burkholderia stagnalis]RQY45482.1 hypothetical protein DF113_05405 [Burkholderia stagnalis]RQY84426.1 hypothetical protein DF107_05790 [Burkholderia stagnalis]
MIDGELMQEPSAGFAALEGVAAGVDADAAAALNPGAAVPPGQPAPGPDYARGAAGMVDLISGMLDGYAPGAGWSEPQRALMAASIAPVLEKYGWDIEGSMPCELMALAVCGPALYQSAKVVALKLQADRIALARAARGLDDPNTVRGGVAAPGGDATAADALRQAASNIPSFPDI